jgi:hypothetical protein
VNNATIPLNYVSPLRSNGSTFVAQNKLYTIMKGPKLSPVKILAVAVVSIGLIAMFVMFARG